MLQAVLLIQHHQTTMTFRPHPVTPTTAQADEPPEDVEVLVPLPEPEEQHGKA